jgi:hypothetical protein
MSGGLRLESVLNDHLLALPYAFPKDIVKSYAEKIRHFKFLRRAHKRSLT